MSAQHQRTPPRRSPGQAHPTSGIKKDIVMSTARKLSRSPITNRAIGREETARSTKTQSSKRKRHVWSSNEDVLLESLVKSSHRDKPKWGEIAETINETLETSRSGKQCRERWRNHLRPNIRKGHWTLEEERLIVNMCQTFGPKWTCMAQVLKNRTDNDIKNKWYSMLRSGKVKYPRTSTRSTEGRDPSNPPNFPLPFSTEEISIPRSSQPASTGIAAEVSGCSAYGEPRGAVQERGYSCNSPFRCGPKPSKGGTVNGLSLVNESAQPTPAAIEHTMAFSDGSFDEDFSYCWEDVCF